MWEWPRGGTEAKPTMERTLTSPGTWQSQGVGNETALELHQYEGVGWYRKQLPLDAGSPGLVAELALAVGRGLTSRQQLRPVAMVTVSADSVA